MKKSVKWCIGAGLAAVGGIAMSILTSIATDKATKEIASDMQQKENETQSLPESNETETDNN